MFTNWLLSFLGAGYRYISFVGTDSIFNIHGIPHLMLPSLTKLSRSAISPTFTWDMSQKSVPAHNKFCVARTENLQFCVMSMKYGLWIYFGSISYMKVEFIALKKI